MFNHDAKPTQHHVLTWLTSLDIHVHVVSLLFIIVHNNDHCPLLGRSAPRNISPKSTNSMVFDI